MKLRPGTTVETPIGANLVWRQTSPEVPLEEAALTSGRAGGENSAAVDYRSYARTVSKGQADAILPNAELAKFKLGEGKSIIFAKNIGGTPVGLELGGHSILFSGINDIGTTGFTGELKGAGSVGGGPEVWPAGRIYDREFKPKIHTATGVIDLSEEHASGLIPKDASPEALLMHGRGFSTDKWKFFDPKVEGEELCISKTLDFNDDPICAKFGPGKLKITYRLGVNPETGNDRLRTVIEAHSTEAGKEVYLSSMALHYFLKVQVGDKLSSSASHRHNSRENLQRPSESHPERPDSGYSPVEDRYDLRAGVDILGDTLRREAVLFGFGGQADAEGLKESARLERTDYTLVMRQKATLNRQKFLNGLLVFNAGPKDTVCAEPYFGAINAQNRLTQLGDNKAFSQPLIVGGDNGNFEAVVDLELEPKK